MAPKCTVKALYQKKQRRWTGGGGIMVRGCRGSEKSEIFESKENKIKE